MKEAAFYRKLKSGVQCQLCPHFCTLKDGATGKCGVRKASGGKLYSLVYEKPCSVAVDPIEKKPFFHFAPGTQTLSIATVGCNLSCQHCQNWKISQYPKLYGEICGEEKTPQSIIETAKASNVDGMSWTYTEPTIFYEYFYDTARIDRKKTFYQTWVSNGFTNPDVIKSASRFLDGVNVDYKGDDKFYRQVCGARLEPVLETLKSYFKNKVWVEITNLVIPGHNDSKESMLEMVTWIRDNLGKNIPMHFSAYHPDYMLNVPPTTVETLEKAVKIADEYLDYVYVGNIFHDRENTFCPKCKAVAIRRMGFSVVKFNLNRKGKEFFCHECGKRIPIAGSEWIK